MPAFKDAALRRSHKRMKANRAASLASEQSRAAGEFLAEAGKKYAPVRATRKKPRNPLNDAAYSGNDEQIQDLKDALDQCVNAAREVINRWSGGDLAGAINELELVIKEYEEK